MLITFLNSFRTVRKDDKVKNKNFMCQEKIKWKTIKIHTWGVSFFSDSALDPVFSEVAKGWDTALSTPFVTSSWAGVSSYIRTRQN